MPKPGKFIVEHDTLQVEPPIRVGSGEWFAWLAHHDRFKFQGAQGHFSAQCEERRKTNYWYAYRRREGKLFKQYLGKADELILERLESASLALAGLPVGGQPSDQPGREQPSGVTAHPPSADRAAPSLLPLTKINSPVLPRQLIVRPRLTGQITTPLVLVYAPSGFGKSTLLNDWKRICGHPVAWLSLDEGDNQPFRFWYSLAVALQAARPEIGREILPGLRAATVPLSEAVSYLTNDLVHCQECLPRLGLVLDDFHHILDPEIYTSLQAWLEHFPPNLQLAIAGHTRPPLALGALRGRGFVTELAAGDLRFTLEEGIHYLQQYPQDPPVAHTDLEKLVRHAEGWAAGLMLTAMALGKHEDRRGFIDTFSGAHIYLREYFLETVFQRTTPEMQTFLIQTAILKNLTGSLCDAVTGRPGGEAVLGRLWQENQFLVRLEEPGWYRYHDLFGEMLLSQLQGRFPGEVPLLHQRAAQWYREQNAPAEAVYHLLAIEAWEEAAALLESMALAELEQSGEDSRLLRWLQELPAAVVQKNKTLLFVYLRLAEMALPRQKVEGFIAHLETNLAGKTAQQLTLDEREVLAEVQRIRQTWQQGQAYHPPAREGNANDARWGLLDDLHLLKQGTLPNSEGLEDQLAGLLQRAQAQPNLFVVLMVGGVLARRAFVRGQLVRSEAIAREILEQAQRLRGKLPEPASIALAVLSEVCLERHELAAAQRYLAQAQEVDPNPTSTNMLVQNAVLRAKILATQGQCAAALANLRAIRELHARRPSGTWTDQDLLAYEAQTHLRGGDVLAAERLLAEAESRGAHALAQWVRAEILLKTGQAEAAAGTFNRLIVQNPNGVSLEPLMAARVQLAVALLEQHKANQALQALCEAVRLATPERFLRPFLENSAGCRPLLWLALRGEKLSGEAQEFVREVLRVSGHAEELAPAEMESLSTSAAINPREQDVLHLLSSGYSNREMAEQLCISESTVKTHLRNIYFKFGVHSRLQAINSAKELKLIR